MGNDKKQLQFRRFERKVKQIEERPNKNIKEINQKGVGGTDRKSVDKRVWYKHKLDSLAKAGIPSDKVICFACLQNHVFYRCPIYKKDINLTETLCFKSVNGKTVPHGFHSKKDCRDIKEHQKQIPNYNDKVGSSGRKVAVWTSKR